MLERIKQTASSIKATVSFNPEIGIILGSGLGGLVNLIDKVKTIPYREIENFPVSTVSGHGGNLIFGYLGGKKVVAMQGRFHYYEGYSMQEVTFPVRVMKQLGIKLLIVSNASGGVNPQFKVGDLMLIKDHINLLPNPLIGKNYDELGPRFPNMHHAYSPKLIELAERLGKENDIPLQKGVYVGLTGPTYETPAEYKFIRAIGGDCVGMSTVPEVIVARHESIAVFAFSLISDLGFEDQLENLSHEEVLTQVKAAEPKTLKLVRKFMEQISLEDL